MSRRNDRTKRRTFMKRCVAGAAGMMFSRLLGGRAGAGRERKPNIIFILADDLGYGELGCYGQREIQTPNIDKLAAEGMRFTDHYAGSTVCAPSRCSLMTGLHMGHAYIRGNREVKPMGQEPLPADSLTVAKLVKKAGYTTGLIGKWGLGGPESTGVPNQQGFDYFYGYLCQRHAHNYYPEFLYRNEERVFVEGNRVEEPRPDGAGMAVERAYYSHDLMTQDTLAFIDRNREKPFFLYLAFTIPHKNNEREKITGDGMEVPSYEPYEDRPWPQAQKGLAAMITRLDRDVGTVMGHLEEQGLDEDTVVFFTSDNGPHKTADKIAGGDPEFFRSSGPLRGKKADLYEGGIRVPMIARWPGKVRAGSVTDHVSAFWDFLPTAADIAGAEPPGEVDGISFLPTLLGEKQKGHEYLYWEFIRGKLAKQAIRMGKWKGVRLHPSAPLELYDLSTDIGESKSVAERHPDVAGKIKALMKTARTESEFWIL